MERTSWPQTTVSPALELVEVDGQAQWVSLAAEFKDNNYRQAWSYGLVSGERHRARVERIAVRAGSEVLGIAEVRLKPIPGLRTGLAYVGGGPLTRRGRANDIAALSACLRTLRDEYIGRRGYMLRILPPLMPGGELDAITQCYRDNGFNDSPWPPPYRTLMVGLDRSLPDIRKALAQKWRNGLNYAERQGMTIASGNDPILYERFERLFESFMDRKQISVDQGADFYVDLRARTDRDEGFLVILAMENETPIAGQLISLLGDTAVNLLGATNEIGLKRKAANLLQWQVILAAKERGQRWYDPGGIDPEGNPGVYHFKAGLGGKELPGPGPFQALPQGPRGWITPNIEKFYRWFKHKR